MTTLFKNKISPCRKSWVKLAIGASLISIQVSIAKDGNGLGSGDGYPTGVSFQKKQLVALPESTALIELFLSLAKDFPSLAGQFIKLVEKFNSDPGFDLIHNQGHYPYQMAVSDHESSRAPGDIPKQASITIWNDFVQEPSSLEREKIMVHELVHILVAGKNHEQAEKLTAFILEWRNKNVSIDVLREMTHFLSSYNLKYPKSEKTLPIYLKAKGIKAACEDFGKSATVVIGLAKLHFPTPPVSWRKNFHSSAKGDPFFAFYRDHCLNQTEEGRSLVRGFFNHPYLHTLLVSQWLTHPVEIKLGPQSIEGHPLSPQVTGGLSELYQEILRENKVAVDLKRIGFGAWLTHRNLFFDENERTSLNYEVGDALRLPLDLLRVKIEFGLDLPEPLQWGALITEASEDRSLLSCEFLGKNAIQSLIETRCTYARFSWFGLRAPTYSKRWSIDDVWSARMFKMHSPVSFNDWQTLPITVQAESQ